MRHGGEVRSLRPDVISSSSTCALEKANDDHVKLGLREQFYRCPYKEERSRT